MPRDLLEKVVLFTVSVLISWMSMFVLGRESGCPEGCGGCMLGTLSCESGNLYQMPKFDQQALDELLRMSQNNNFVSISKIQITEQNFGGTELTQHNMSAFSQRPLFDVREVIVKNCSLKSVGANAFSPLKSLKLLELSANSLETIHSTSFKGLKLKLLQLDDNNRLILPKQGFHQLQVESLSLRGCGLSRLETEFVDVLLPALKNLYLNRNNFRFLHYNDRPLFSRLSNIDLSQNPLECGCDAAWLTQISATGQCYFKNTDKESEYEISIPDWLKLFHCAPPRITQFYIDAANSGHLNLVCVVESSEENALISWSPTVQHSNAPFQSYPSESLSTLSSSIFIPALHKLPYQSNSQKSLNSVTSPIHTLRSQIGLSSLNEWHNYSCQANSQSGNTTSSIRLHWPQHEIMSKFIVDSSRMQNNAADNPILQLKFTLLHVLLACVLTLVSTLLLFIVVVRLCFCRKKFSPQQFTVVNRTQTLNASKFDMLHNIPTPECQIYDEPLFPTKRLKPLKSPYEEPTFIDFMP